MVIPDQKVCGIILAAGSASRMGMTKQLLPFKGKPLIAHVIENSKQSNLYEIIVVLGHCAAKIIETVDFSGVQAIVNHDYLKGQSTSIIKGLDKISPFCDAAMFLLGDQPLVHKSIINTILKTYKTCTSSITIPYYNNIRGNPVIIGKSLFSELRALSGDTGPRILFEKYKNSIQKVSVSDKTVLVDVDTKTDYERLKSTE